jgi:putative nucleotidyltransferase with HDIG domain
MRFATRTFLWVFIPFAAMMALNFWAFRMSVTSAVRDGLREAVLRNQTQIAAERARAEQRMARVLGVVAENPALKAGLQLLITERQSRDEARRTVEDQLSEICGSLGFEFLVVFDPAGQSLAGIVRGHDGFEPMDLQRVHPPQKGLFTTEGKIYQVTSIPVKQGPEEMAVLAVGENFDLAAIATPAVLMLQGSVVRSHGLDLPGHKIAEALRDCAEECVIHVEGGSYLSLPMETASTGQGLMLRSLQSVDAAAAPVLASLRQIFVTGSAVALLAAIGIAGVSSRSIVRPLAAVVEQLRMSRITGTLREFPAPRGGTQEVRELAEGFNQAAAAISQGQQQLSQAFIDFAGSMAHALDARDPYTAGHSQRVSDYACAIGRAMDLPPEQLETLRVGALLHDIGKIGVSDAVLQKPGKLTAEETTLIQQHPTIGRRILENIHGFERYLPIVELHHENWDGRGYPRGLKQEETPLVARIVKVADAYDAMTTDRPYRRGMTHEEAIRVIEQHAGTALDARVARAFVELDFDNLQIGTDDLARESGVAPERRRPASLENLAAAVAIDKPAAAPYGAAL